MALREVVVHLENLYGTGTLAILLITSCFRERLDQLA